jgi:hypothetical protein
MIPTALYTALDKLGYRSYHYIETRYNKKHNHIRCWLEALNAKLYGTGKRYGGPEFDKVLAKYTVRSSYSVFGNLSSI